MKHKLWNIKSFSTRLSLWVTLVVAIALLSTAIVANIYVYEGTLREEKLRANIALENAEHHIRELFIAVEVAVKNNAANVTSNLDAPHEEMYNITRNILETNPFIVGSAIAFEPNYYPDEGHFFSPYSYRQSPQINEHKPNSGDSIFSKQLGSPTYNYHTMEWYKTPREQKKGYWSEPYRDTGGGDMTMITFSYPLLDKNGKVYAIMTADVSLDWMSGMLDTLKYYDQSYCFILSRNGTYITNPNKKRILNETIFSTAQEKGDSTLARIGRSMISGGTNMMRMQSPSLGDSYIFYKPLQPTGWSMAIVCSSDDFFRAARQSGTFISFLILGMLLILVILLQKGLHRLTQPLAMFTKAVNEVANGNLQATLPEVHTRDEMLRLHNSFITMQKSLVQQMQELKQVNEQKGRIEGELKVASDIQRAMLPKVFPPYPDRDDIDIYGLQTPAKEVGGDLYDFYIRDEKLFFCIGDVSGKGVPASLVMVVMRSLFRTLSAHESHPDRIISQMNERMSENNEQNMFVTMFIGVLDLPTGRLRYCNAGHDAPILITQTSDGFNTAFLPCNSNIPVGAIHEWNFTLQETNITPGTIMFLYTDGLTEAENNTHELFGEQRIIDALIHSNSQNIIERMIDQVHTFIGDAEQSDDLTMLAVRYTRQENPLLFHKDITLHNDVDEVPLLADFVDEVCELVSFDTVTAMQMNLALEEAVVNVMNYAYPKGTVGTIQIEAAANVKRLKFIISDNGMPFDPTSHRPADTSLSAEERPIGGLGIHLITQLMDSINYERKDDKNILTLRKKL